jgi:hypothetical protein
MTRLRVFLLIIAVGIVSLRADDLLKIPDFEASKHVGQTVEVRGSVAWVNTSGENFFVDLGGKYPNQKFTAIIRSGTEASRDKDFLQSLMGKEIAIQGIVTLYKGKPGIEITERSQIEKYLPVKWPSPPRDEQPPPPRSAPSKGT